MINRGPLSGLMMVLLLVVVGCSRKAAPSTTTEVTDSIHVREVPRFFEVKIPGDTVTVVEYIECDSVTNKPKPFTIKSKSKRASIVVNVDKNGLLTSTGVCDSLQQVIQAMDKEIFRLRIEKSKKVVPAYITRDIDKACRWIAGIVLLFGFYKVFRFLNLKF